MAAADAAFQAAKERYECPKQSPRPCGHFECGVAVECGGRAQRRRRFL